MQKPIKSKHNLSIKPIKQYQTNIYQPKPQPKATNEQTHNHQVKHRTNPQNNATPQQLTNKVKSNNQTKLKQNQTKPQQPKGNNRVNNKINPKQNNQQHRNHKSKPEGNSPQTPTHNPNKATNPKPTTQSNKTRKPQIN